MVNAREHNLKNLSVQIPRGKFNVITGVSAVRANPRWRLTLCSTKASAATWKRSTPTRAAIVQPAGRPEVDAVYGIPPTVAIEQRLSRGGRKSTVGTTTEVWHFLRLLYVKLGAQHCVHDDAAGAAANARPHSWRRSCSSTGPAASASLAPLVVAAQGRLYRTGRTGRARAAIRICAWMAVSADTRFPAH